MKILRKLFGFACVLIGVLCGCVLYSDITNGIFNWRLINILTVPINIVLGVELALNN